MHIDLSFWFQYHILLQPRRALINNFQEKKRIQLTASPPADHVVVIFTAGIARLPTGIYSVRHGPLTTQLYYHPPRWSLSTRGGVDDAVTAPGFNSCAAE